MALLLPLRRGKQPREQGSRHQTFELALKSREMRESARAGFALIAANGAPVTIR
jgi:hypothetical protein